MRVVDRSTWRLVLSGMHLAATEAEAVRDIGRGLSGWLHDFWRHAGLESVDLPTGEAPIEAPVAACNGAGYSLIGTPEHAIAFIEKLQAAIPGFGTHPGRELRRRLGPLGRPAPLTRALRTLRHPLLQGQVEPQLDAYEYLATHRDEDEIAGRRASRAHAHGAGFDTAGAAA
jgi:hypothetical protein